MAFFGLTGNRGNRACVSTTNTAEPSLARAAQSSATKVDSQLSLTRKAVLADSRVAYGLRRYHTWPVIVQQTLADHVGNMFRIYWLLFKRVPPEVAEYIIWHDAGEGTLGDLPFPVKAENPKLKGECDGVERRAVWAMGGKLPTLTPVEQARVKCVDLLEMMEFGVMERRLGNAYAQPIIDDISVAIQQKCKEFSRQDAAIVREYVKRVAGV